jgi:hypothetical protein
MSNIERQPITVLKLQLMYYEAIQISWGNGAAEV